MAELTQTGNEKHRPGESWREWLKVGIPILLLSGAAFAFAWRFVKPAPPSHVVIATGSETGLYYASALKYAEYFGRNGIVLEVRKTAGSVENYKLLNDPASGVDLAIVQTGTAPPPDQRPKLQGIASVYYEPVWVFYRADKPITRIAELAGKKIAVGPEGSGVRPLATMLLNDSGVTDVAPTQFVALSTNDAAAALREGKVDAAFFVIGPTADVIRSLLETDGIRLMSFEHAHAYARRFPYLSAVTLYKGTIDTRRNLPEQDVQLIAPAATLIMRDGTHQAIVGLLVQAAAQFHAGPSLLNDPGVFPTADKSELPVGADAKWFLTNKPSLLHRTLPFWLASLIDRLLILLLPLMVVLLPLLRMTPPLYRWSVRKRIFRWYGRVRRIDDRLREPTRSEFEAALQELLLVEKEVSTVRVPLSYMDQLYNLRLHIGLVRQRLEAAASTQPPATALN